MQHKIKIIKNDFGKYSFIVDNFSSIKHNILCSSVNDSYSYAWDAYKDAKNMVIKYPYHLNALKNKRYAMDEYSDLVVTDISADDMLVNHYTELYESFEERAKGLPKEDKDEAKIIYGEIKAVVGEILKAKEAIKKKSEEHTNKNFKESDYDSIINKFSRLTKKYFNGLLMEDARKEKESANPKGSPSDTGFPVDGGAGGAGGAGEMPPSGMPPVSAKSYKDYLIKTASVKVSNDEIGDVLNYYCDVICNSLKEIDRNIIGNINISRKNILLKNSSGPIVEVRLNDNLMVSGIIPIGETREIYPLNSPKFYQKYWKRIAEAVGHYCFSKGDEKHILLSNNLPDIPKNASDSKVIKSWNCVSKKDDSVSINFSNDKNKFWNISGENINKTASLDNVSRYTEQDYFKNGIPAMVVCIDPKLKTIFKRTGKVLRVFPIDDIGVIAEIDFGNNVIVRLKEEKFEIIDVDSPVVMEKNKIQRK